MNKLRNPSLAVVFSGGGARAAYQAGVLSAFGELSDDQLQFSLITGVSAGAINAAALASSQGTLSEAASRLGMAWNGLTIENVFKTDLPSVALSIFRWVRLFARSSEVLPTQVRGILDTTPLWHFLGHQIDLSGVRRNLSRGRLSALALSATSYNTGQTVTFVEGYSTLRNWERAGRRGMRAQIGLSHVMASSALPLVFPAVPISGEYFGDGSIRQNAPLAPAIHLGAQRIVAISLRYPRSRAEASESQVQGYPPPGQILGMLLNAIFLDALEADVERLERINRTLDLFPPETQHPEGLRKLQLLVLRPSRDLGKLSAGLSDRLPRFLQLLVRGLGVQLSRTPDFLSYLLFERPYLDRLKSLGYEDTRKAWPRIEQFLS